MCAPTAPWLRPPLGSARRPRERGFARGWGRGCRAALRTRRLPAVGSLGKVAPGAGPARPPARRRCTSFRKRRRDRALQGSYPFPQVPAERSRGSALLARPRGKPWKAEGTRLGSTAAPHFNSRSLGPLTAAEGRPTAVRAPAL